MNFPVDARSPIVRVVEVEETAGQQQLSTWEMKVKFANDFEATLDLVVTPHGYTYSFCKCTEIHEADSYFQQNYVVKISNLYMVRMYEMRIKWHKAMPSAQTTSITQVCQKTLLTTVKTAKVRPLHDKSKRINGFQVFIEKWYDMPSLNQNLKFKGDFTLSTFKRIFKLGRQMCLLLDIYLKEEAMNLSHQEIQLIFASNERTLLSMVPNKVEHGIMTDPENKVWLLRPEARYNGQNQLALNTHIPNKVSEILDHCIDTDICAEEGQVPSLIQELFRCCSDESKKVILSDFNIPRANEFAFDFNLKSPISTPYSNKTFVGPSLEKTLDYFSNLPFSSQTQLMFELCLEELSFGEKLQNLPRFLTYDDSAEEKHTEKMAKVA